MLMTKRRKMRVGFVSMVGVTAVLCGCAPPSLLITPVSSRRALVESELSRDSFLASSKIAVVYLSGVMMNQESQGLLSTGEHSVSLFVEQLDKARKDPSVKAVVLRINSPGGTVVASELMHDEVMHFKKSGKPIIAVMMDVAASGAYYVACACDEIVAQPSTVTGSIGVVMQMLDLSGTMQMIGVKSDAIISGRFKDTGSPFRQMREEEREIFQAIVNDMYERFVGVVVEGRADLDEVEVRRLADGRVYTASQAVEVGLIDRVATMREVIAGLKERIGVKRVRVVTYHRPEEYRPNYYAAAAHDYNGDISLLKFDLRGWPGNLTPRFMYLWAPGIE